MASEYDVSSYTEDQLLSILNLNNPSDRELEAKILLMIRKYKNLENPSGDKLATFFSDIYDRFFETEEEENTVEGFLTLPDSFDSGNLQIHDLGNLQAAGANVNTLPPGITKAYNLLSGSGKDEPGEVGSANVGYMISQGQGQGAKQEQGVQLTKPLEYSKDNLNPLLKQTIKRIISIDSQYRDNKNITPTTNFTFNLSEPLRDVVSLSLYSIQIPYTWYTVNSNFGGNFFYLKGNVPGIDNGYHDYQVSIPSANYIASDLVATVNTSLKALSTTYTDVDFGTTQAVYNNGLQSNASGTSKAQLQIDITKVFNESNYYLDFTDNWSTPNSVKLPIGTNTGRDKTLGGYLGFNHPTQSCSAIYSNYFPYFSTADYANNITVRECIVNNNGTFTVVPYLGEKYQAATKTYPPITITIPNGKYTQVQLVAQLSLALASHPDLDPNYSFCKWIDVSGQDSYGIPLYQSGYSYLQISCKLNQKTAPIVQNLKIAAIFPKTSTSIFVDTSMNNYASYFKVTYAYQANNEDTSGNIVCEFNTLYGDASILQTNYVVAGTNQIRYICTASGYENALNDYTITIPISGAAGYTLLQYINVIRDSITSYTNVPQKTIANTQFTFEPDNHLYLQTSIRTLFSTAQYQISATGKINNLFDILAGFTNLSSKNVFSNPKNESRIDTYNSKVDTIIIKPLDNQGNSGSKEFVIGFDGQFPTALEMESYFQKTIANFQDSAGRKPLSNSTVIYAPSTGFILTVNVQLSLNQNDYKLVFYSDPSGGSGAGPNADPSNNVWSKDLSFDLSYNLGVNSATVNANGTFTTVKNNEVENSNQITINATNDTFYLTPYSTINGLQTATNMYRVPIIVPRTAYSIVQLVSTINELLSQNPLSSGTSLSLVSINGSSFISVRFNINKVFSTKDYRVVFYDPFSFVKCYSGAARKGAQAVQNATWDSTLGWLLGFRNSIEYELGQYVGTTDVANSANYLGYYLTTAPNACVLFGDTCVSTNLYNYFLIMLDDYVQNHLNDGLVTISSQETSLSHAPSKIICDPTTGKQRLVPADYGDPGVNYTQSQLYAFNQQVQSEAAKTKSYSSGPFVRDTFGIVPIKTAGLNVGSSYVEFGGTLQNQQRLYFGPVNINRMTIQLLNDRGNLVDLNNANWSFSLMCEQLYKNGYS
jgi:hypothetical protein